jgi:hypothetical protein
MDNTDDSAYFGRPPDALRSWPVDGRRTRPVLGSTDSSAPHFKQVTGAAGRPAMSSRSGISPGVWHAGHSNFIFFSLAQKTITMVSCFKVKGFWAFLVDLLIGRMVKSFRTD